MAPALTETVAAVADEISNKASALSLESTKPEEDLAVKDVPATQHKEPLKLSGALDHFQSFDVTPIIGKEFVGVNLAKWLRAPNSDDLIRDLAITSMLPVEKPNCAKISQSPNEV